MSAASMQQLAPGWVITRIQELGKIIESRSELKRFSDDFIAEAVRQGYDIIDITPSFTQEEAEYIFLSNIHYSLYSTQARIGSLLSKLQDEKNERGE